jgi:hypothetical protein
VLGKKLQYCLLGVWLTLSAGIFIWGVWPRSYESRYLTVPGVGKMTLEWDSHNPTGDISVIELSLDLDEKDDLAVVLHPRNKVNFISSPRYPGIIDKVKVTELAEARLELPGIDVKPREIVGQPYHPGGEVVFYWNVKSHIEGDFMGRIWLYVGNQPFLGKDANRYPIAVQPVEFHWRDLFGLSGTTARYIGLFGLTAGILLPIVIWHQARRVP